jgi:DNA-binding response OmpR family regulator
MTIAHASTDRRTVLLVDDDSSTLDLYGGKLDHAGFRTMIAPNPAGFYEALPNLSADLIILNLMLPKRGGFELLRAIRANDLHRSTPVLVLTNPYLPDLAQRSLQMGGSRALSRSECTTSQLVSISRELMGMTAADETDEASEVERMKQVLMDEGSSEVTAIQHLVSKYIEVAALSEGEEHLVKLHQKVRSLEARAGLAGCRKIAQLAAAIEAMLFDHLSRPNDGFSPSCIQTFSTALDCLNRLFANRDTGSTDHYCGPRVLLVDDDRVCNMGNDLALKRAYYETVIVTNGPSAIRLLTDEDFDLVLLDIEMPDMSGLEVCRKLREIPRQQTTPVIFVTAHADFKNRVESIRSGGDDLISKPIAPSELIVKSTVYLLNNPNPRIAQQRSSSDAKAKEFGSQKQSGDPARTSKRLKHLQEALAEETKRRETVDQQAAENAKRRKDLETAIEENQRSQQRFLELLEEAQQQSQAAEQGDEKAKLNLAGRRRALTEVKNFVADKLVRLKKALKEETERCRVVEEQVAENAMRRADLECALREIQGVQDAFQDELHSAQDPAALLELEASLEKSQKARESLAGELEATRRELLALKESRAGIESEVESRKSGR